MIMAKQKAQKKSRLRSSLERYQDTQRRVYLKAYNSGWNDCEKHSYFGSSLIASNGYGAGYKARKRSYKADDRLLQYKSGGKK